MNSLIIVSIVLVMSLIFNGIMYWYSRKLTQKLAFIYDNVGDVSELIANYRVHLKSVYQMEMFYGEPIIQELIEKTKLLREEIERFESIYNLTTDVELIEEEMLSDGNQEETQEAH